MAYKILGGSHIAYYDNTAKGVGRGTPDGQARKTTASKAGAFEAVLKSAENQTTTQKSTPQSPPSPRISPPRMTAQAPPATGTSGAPEVATKQNWTMTAPSATAPAGKESMAAATTSITPAKRRQGAERSHTVKPGETIWELAVKVYNVDPEELQKLNNISDPRKLQIGQLLRIPGKLQSTGKEEVVASWYGAEHHGRPMANGDPFNMYAATIAHKELPLGTRVLLENPATGEKVTATVTDRGPYIAGRDVDLSYRLAQRLSLEHQGVGSLTMEIL